MVSVVREIPESVSFAVTDAEGTAAPDGSVTLPDKFADTCPCAEREHKTSRDSRKTEKRPPANDMIHPFPGSEKYRRNRCGRFTDRPNLWRDTQSGAISDSSHF